MTPDEERAAALEHRGEDYLRVLEMADRGELFVSVNGPYRRTTRRAVTLLVGPDWLAFTDLQCWAYVTEELWPGNNVYIDGGLLSLHTVELTREGRDLLGVLRWPYRQTRPST